MTLPALVSEQELADWLEQPVTNLVRAEAIRFAASTLVRTFTGRTWVDAADALDDDIDEDDLEVAKTVTKTVAERVLLNPSGVTQQATGPFSKSVAAWSALGLELSDSERAMLRGYVTSVRPALWTQATTRTDLAGDTQSIYVVGSDKPLPVSTEPW